MSLGESSPKDSSLRPRRARRWTPWRICWHCKANRRARSRGRLACAARVRRALASRSRSPAVSWFNLSWPMRGTVHVTSARDHHWLRRLLRHRRAAWERQAISMGLTDALVERAAQVACALLETSPQGVSRVELVEASGGSADRYGDGFFLTGRATASPPHHAPAPGRGARRRSFACGGASDG